MIAVPRRCAWPLNMLVVCVCCLNICPFIDIFSIYFTVLSCRHNYNIIFSSSQLYMYPSNLT
jgi:hypothetical protein